MPGVPPASGKQPSPGGGLGAGTPWVKPCEHQDVPDPLGQALGALRGRREGGSRYQVPEAVHGPAVAVLPLRLLPVVLLDVAQVLLPHLPAGGLGLLPEDQEDWEWPLDQGGTGWGGCTWTRSPGAGPSMCWEGCGEQDLPLDIPWHRDSSTLPRPPPGQDPAQPSRASSSPRVRAMAPGWGQPEWGQGLGAGKIWI